MIPRDIKKGQSLIELLVAISVGAILFLGAASLIAPSLKINKTTGQVEAATGLGEQLLDNVRVWSEGNWHGVLALATSSANTYYLSTSSSPFAAATGTESVTIGTTTYTRFFYLGDVYRDGSGNATSTSAGNTYDPSTKAVTVVYGWPRGTTTTITAYLTRNHTIVLDQTDWSGGPGAVSPLTSPNNQFTTSSNINYTGMPGSLLGVTPAYPNGYLYRRTITASSSVL